MCTLSAYNLRKDNRVGKFVEFNTTIKHYSDGSKQLRYNSFSNLKGVVRDNKKNGSSTIKQLKEYSQRHLFERKAMIMDLAYENGLCKPWEYFVTLTFDDEIVDGYSHEKVTHALHEWLHYQHKCNLEMRYLIIPELHKSGRLHFHGLFSDVPNWKLSEARSARTGRLLKKNGSQIYNLDNYRLGFTTISKVKSIEAVSRYITKYITKELLNLKFKKNYWRSRNLVLPRMTYHYTDFEELDQYLQNKECITNMTQKRDSYSIFSQIL